jgi:hypothetical protein
MSEINEKDGFPTGISVMPKLTTSQLNINKVYPMTDDDVRSLGKKDWRKSEVTGH